VEQNGKFRNKPIHLWSDDLTRMTELFNEQSMAHSTTGAGNLAIYVPKNGAKQVALRVQTTLLL
jgi:hypothetical protein